MNERDPLGYDQHSAGSKLDAGKPCVRRGVLEYFPRALMAVAEVSMVGADKYTWDGWKSVPDGVNRYGNAGVRHILKAAIEGERDLDTGLLHAAHEAWNALARLERILVEKDRAARLEAEELTTTFGPLRSRATTVVSRPVPTQVSVEWADPADGC